MSVRSHHASEEGAVAVLYSITMLLFLGLLALALDLGALRADRRANQSAADLASLAGAMDLVAEGGGPQAACESAWAYLLENTDETPRDEPSPCGVFAGMSCDPTMAFPTPTTAEATIADTYAVAITWPVPDPAADEKNLLGDVSRFDPEIDGNPCERLSVQIGRIRSFVFGGAVGYLEGFATGPAIARATLEEQRGQAAALVVLDPFSCNVLTQSGGGGGKGAIHVFEDDEGGPGIVQVDSDATDTSTCKNANSYVMDASGGGTEIKAGVFDDDGDRDADDLDGDGRSDVRNGFIFSYALLTRDCTASENSCAFESADVPTRVASGSTPQLKPVAGNRSTRDDFEYLYDCRTDYSFPGHVPVDDCDGAVADPDDPDYLAEAHVTNLRTEIRGHIADGTMPDGFTAVPCDPGTWTVPFPSGQNWWFDCDLVVGTTLDIPDGNVVVTGSLTVKGTLRLNADSTTDNYVYIGRDFGKDATGSIRLGNPSPLEPNPTDKGGTFVYLETPGRIDMQGGAGFEFTWIAPYGGPFEDLGLWSEYSNKAEKPHDLGGDLSNLETDGVYYMPDAKFLFRGSGEMKQQRAQFVAYRLQAAGQGALRVQPDPERAVQEFGVVVNLIR